MEIRPWSENPRYWEFRGEPVLLIGGSDTASPHVFEFHRWDEDWADETLKGQTLEEQLEVLVSHGGNYIRSILHSRDHHRPYLPTPWMQQKDGRFDLDVWNPDYWDGFARLLKETAKRDIIVQVEFWDGGNFQGRTGGQPQRWDQNPLNPTMNINYGTEDSSLPTHWEATEWDQPHPILQTVPGLKFHNPIVLAYLEAFVEKIMDHTLPYDHVLYTIQNESWAAYEWSTHWADFARKQAEPTGRTLFISDMRSTDTVDPVFQYGFDFADVSQSAEHREYAHYRRIADYWEQLSERPVPMNSLKQYGGEMAWTRGPLEGIDRVWRTLFAGQASARFHRPPWGLGLGNDPQANAQKNIRSLRLITKEMDLANVQPHQNLAHLLADLEENDAYIFGHPGKYLAVYFTGRGESVTVDISAFTGPVYLRWLDPQTALWTGSPATLKGKRATLTLPGSGKWVAVLKKG